MCALALLGIAVSLVVGLLLGGPTDQTANLITFSLFIAASSLVGAFVAARRSENAIGWILCCVALVGAVTAVGQAYLETNPQVAGEGARFVDWLMAFIWTPAFAPILFVLQLFPTGRALSPRWRFVTWMTATGIALVVSSYAFSPGALQNAEIPVDNPYGVEALETPLAFAEGTGGLLIFGTVVLSLVLLVLRFRRTRGIERQQLKWLAYSGIVIGFVVALQVFGETLLIDDDQWMDLFNALFAAALTFVPVSVGIALLRYRLYDIDRIIGRTLAYGALTAVLAVGYLLAILILQSLLPLPDDSPLIVAASTLAVVAAFGSLRARIQAAVDRRFNRTRYDAERTVAEFGGHLRSQVEIGGLSRDLVEVVDRTMHPAHTSLWLRPLGERR